jgi:hypothetical protein
MKSMKKFMMMTALTGFLFFSVFSAFSQSGPPPPPPEGGHGQITNQPPQGGNAPIGDGIILLLVLSIVYGCARIYFEKRSITSGKFADSEF